MHRRINISQMHKKVPIIPAIMTTGWRDLTVAPTLFTMNRHFRLLSTVSSASIPSSMTKYKVLIIGGGSAGASIAAKIMKHHRTLLSTMGTDSFTGPVAVIDPAVDHYYQPLWTLVGAGLKRVSESRRLMKNVMAQGVELIQDSVTSVSPHANFVNTPNGQVSVCWDHLNPRFTQSFQRFSTTTWSLHLASKLTGTKFVA